MQSGVWSLVQEAFAVLRAILKAGVREALTVWQYVTEHWSAFITGLDSVTQIITGRRGGMQDPRTRTDASSERSHPHIHVNHTTSAAAAAPERYADTDTVFFFFAELLSFAAATPSPFKPSKMSGLETCPQKFLLSDSTVPVYDSVTGTAVPGLPGVQLFTILRPRLLIALQSLSSACPAPFSPVLHLGSILLGVSQEAKQEAMAGGLLEDIAACIRELHAGICVLNLSSAIRISPNSVSNVQVATMKNRGSGVTQHSLVPSKQIVSLRSDLQFILALLNNVCYKSPNVKQYILEKNIIPVLEILWDICSTAGHGLFTALLTLITTLCTNSPHISRAFVLPLGNKQSLVRKVSIIILMYIHIEMAGVCIIVYVMLYIYMCVCVYVCVNIYICVCVCIRCTRFIFLFVPHLHTHILF